MPAAPPVDRLIEQGNALLARRSPSAAAECFLAAATADPRSTAAVFGLGVARMDLREFAAARSAFEAVIGLDARHAGAHFNLGFIARTGGEYADAARHFALSVAQRPDHVPSRVNLGVVLLQLHDYRAAAEHLAAALSLDPAQPQVRGRLGVALAGAGRVLEGLPMMEQALARNPADRYVGDEHALALHAIGETDRAVDEVRRALAARPDDSGLHSNLLALMHYSPSFSLEEIHAEHLRWAERHAAPITPAAAHDNAPDAERCLRVGLVTAHVVAGPVPSVLLPLLENVDRTRLAFSLYANSRAEDATTGRLRAAVARWRCVEGVPDDVVAGQVRDDGIDVLIDLAGHTGGNRLLLFARKPAPVQVTWLDYFDTTGLAAIDCLLSDPVHTPEGGRQRFVERVLRMPVTRLCFEPPAVDVPVAPPPVLARGRPTFGSFNRFGKTNPAVVSLWSRILQAIPDARLVLKARELADPGVRGLALERFARAGVDPTRLELRGPSPFRQMLAEYADVDLALDPFPHNGGATTLNALWMGVPVLALAGEGMIARQTAAMLEACGLSELVADSGDALVAMALRWSRDPTRLASLRQAMRSRVGRSALCDGRRFASDFEAVIRDPWRRWCARQSDARAGGVR